MLICRVSGVDHQYFINGRRERCRFSHSEEEAICLSGV